MPRGAQLARVRHPSGSVYADINLEIPESSDRALANRSSEGLVIPCDCDAGIPLGVLVWFSRGFAISLTSRLCVDLRHSELGFFGHVDALLSVVREYIIT